VVRLVEPEEPFLLVGPVFAHAARERVGDPAEEVAVGLVLEQRLEPDHGSGAWVAVGVTGADWRSPDEAGQVLVESLHAELDLFRQLLLDAERVVEGALGEEVRGSEDDIRLLRVRWLVEDTDTALERGAPPLGVSFGRFFRARAANEIVASVEARTQIGVAAVARVIEAEPRHHAQPLGGLELELGIPGGSEQGHLGRLLPNLLRNERPWTGLARARGRGRPHH